MNLINNKYSLYTGWWNLYKRVHDENIFDMLLKAIKNMYTKIETYRVLGLSENVMINLAAGKFNDWDSEFNKLYRWPKPGFETRNHLFTFTYKNISEVLFTTKPEFNSTTISTQKSLKMKKGWDIVDRQNYLVIIKPRTIPNPGLSD